MDWITTSGKTLHEAKSNALDQLGIVADEAEFDVVNDVEKSLFGRVKTEARVRARVRPRQIPEKDDRNNRRRNSNNKGGGNNRRNKKNDGGEGSSKNRNSNQGGGQKKSGSDQKTKQKAGNGNGAQNNGGPKQDNGNQKSSRGKSGNNRNRSGAGQAAAATAAPKKEKPVETEISREEQERIATGFLDGLLGSFEMNGTVAVVEEEADDGAIELTVTGQELGLLVGQKGATLNALQELTRTVVQRNADGAKTDRLRVDVAGYRARRTAALADFATKIANDVLESGSEKLLEPMGPADRKVVHDTVNGIDGVETGSEGEEPRRRVVIRPV